MYLRSGIQEHIVLLSKPNLARGASKVGLFFFSNFWEEYYEKLFKKDLSILQ